MPWPIGMLPIVEPDHSFSGSTIPGLSPGKSMPVGRPKPNREIHCAEPVLPEPLRQRDRADVRRAGEDLGDGHRLGPARLGVVDDAVGDLDLVRQRERASSA